MISADIINAIIGGVLIGIAASGMMFTNGRIMGVSGIIGGLLTPQPGDLSWRVLFVLGIIFGSLLIPYFGFSIMEVPINRGLLSSGLGGLLVGIGTSLGNGCTSGHGVCGISRLSLRSLAATAVFMFFGFVVVAALSKF